MKDLILNWHLVVINKNIFASPALHYFLYNNVDADFFNSHEEALRYYEELDDTDIWSALKVWMHSDDKILSLLASDILNRNIFKVEVHEENISPERIAELEERISKALNISKEEAQYFICVDTIQKDMYDTNDASITILYKDGNTKDIVDASEILNIALLSKKIRKYYLCYQRI